MMEFMLSKLWMMLIGLALTAGITAAFTGLQQDEEAERAEGAAKEMASLLEMMDGLPDGSVCEIDVSSVLRPGMSMQLANGSVWVQWADGRQAAACDAVLYGLERETMVHDTDRLRLCAFDVDGQTVIGVQLEKVDAISFTASTNLLASASVL